MGKQINFPSSAPQWPNFEQTLVRRHTGMIVTTYCHVKIFTLYQLLYANSNVYTYVCIIEWALCDWKFGF